MGPLDYQLVLAKIHAIRKDLKSFGKPASTTL